MTRSFPRHRYVPAVVVAALLTALSTLPAHGSTHARCDSPVTPVRVSRLASLPTHDWLPGHRGIDLAATIDQTVAAPASGDITFVGYVVDRPVVSVRHPGGLVSSLEPVDATVSVGDHVNIGATLGTVASVAGHCAPATCVHWGLRLNGRYVDPLDYLRGFGPVQLLPLTTVPDSPL